MRTETKVIINKYYSKEEQILLKKLAKIIEINPRNKEAQREVWKYDQSLGGLGAYAASPNPVANPFNSWGEYRNVFRSLQYARSDMFYHERPRHVITDSALHIEALVKLVLSNHNKLSFAYKYREFGKNVYKLYEKKLIDDKIYERLNYLKKLLNFAKHDTDANRDYTFDYEDAIIFYFECRQVGNILLKLLNHYTCNNIYQIQE